MSAPQLEGRAYLRLVLLGGLIGIPAALVAALLVGLDGVDAVPAAVLGASAAWLTVAAVDPR